MGSHSVGVDVSDFHLSLVELALHVGDGLRHEGGRGSLLLPLPLLFASFRRALAILLGLIATLNLQLQTLPPFVLTQTSGSSSLESPSVRALVLSHGLLDFQCGTFASARCSNRALAVVLVFEDAATFVLESAWLFLVTLLAGTLLSGELFLFLDQVVE